jgi:hypothetical protein
MAISLATSMIRRQQRVVIARAPAPYGYGSSAENMVVIAWEGRRQGRFRAQSKDHGNEIWAAVTLAEFARGYNWGDSAYPVALPEEEGGEVVVLALVT